MAEINIEKKQGTNIWAWLIPLLLVAALLWWFFGRGGDEVTTAIDADTAAVAAGDVADADAAAGAPITDVVAIVAVPDRMPLIGRRVQLTSVPVLSVPGDETFWVGSSESERLFVALDPAPGTSAPVESPTDVDAGQRVTVAGVLRQVPTDLAEWRTRWNLDDATAEALTAGQVYLAADRVAIAQPR